MTAGARAAAGRARAGAAARARRGAAARLPGAPGAAARRPRPRAAHRARARAGRGRAAAHAAATTRVRRLKRQALRMHTCRELQSQDARSGHHVLHRAAGQEERAERVPAVERVRAARPRPTKPAQASWERGRGADESGPAARAPGCRPGGPRARRASATPQAARPWATCERCAAACARCWRASRRATTWAACWPPWRTRSSGTSRSCCTRRRAPGRLTAAPPARVQACVKAHARRRARAPLAGVRQLDGPRVPDACPFGVTPPAE